MTGNVETKTTTQSTSRFVAKTSEIYLRTSHVISKYQKWQHWYQWSRTSGAVSRSLQSNYTFVSS